MTQSLQLHLIDTLLSQDLKYQVLTIELTSHDRLIEPQDLTNLELPEGIDTTGGVVISGRALTWLYAYLTHELHPTAWVACYDPRLGAVVVATHSRLVRIGQVITVNVLNVKKNSKSPPSLCPALMIVGPPDSGKSVFSHALFTSLLPDYPDIYLHRAHWDGEGNYLLEMSQDATEAEIEELKKRDRGSLTERFFPYHQKAILELRRQKSLVIVDVGGMVQPEKLPILSDCTHYLIISSKVEAVDAWHEFCGDRGNLTSVGVIHSSLSEVEIIHDLIRVELTSGAWIRGKLRNVPEVLLKRIKGLLSYPR